MYLYLYMYMHMCISVYMHTYQGLGPGFLDPTPSESSEVQPEG